MPTVFISHANEDKSIARQINQYLLDNNIRTWFDESEIYPGEEIISKIAHVIEEIDFFLIIISDISIKKNYVLKEMRLAVVSEIENSKPKVIILRNGNVKLPPEIKDKLYIDIKTNFEESLKVIDKTIKGQIISPSISKQHILAKLIFDCDQEFWSEIKSGAAKCDVTREEFANIVREMQDDELESCVFIGIFRGDDQRCFEDDLIQICKRKYNMSESRVERIIKKLIEKGFFSREKEDVLYPEPFLYILKNIAKKSGIFPIKNL